MKRLIALILIFILAFPPAIAKPFKAHASMNSEFHIEDDEITEIKFAVGEDIKLAEVAEIPAMSVISARIVDVQRERRWHRSGYIICRLKNYKENQTAKTVDLYDKEIYLLIRKYEKINKKDAAILSTEIVLTQAASIVGSCFIIFAPVDIVYFFTKGAIQREKDPNWFKAGVSCAWDNSIFWFQLKGKNTELDNGDEVSIKAVDNISAQKLAQKAKKNNYKYASNQNKKQVKKIKKQVKKYMKMSRKEAKYQAKKAKAESKEFAKSKDIKKN